MRFRITGSCPDGSTAPPLEFESEGTASLSNWIGIYRRTCPSACHVRVNIALPYTPEAQDVYEAMMESATD